MIASLARASGRTSMIGCAEWVPPRAYGNGEPLPIRWASGGRWAWPTASRLKGGECCGTSRIELRALRSPRRGTLASVPRNDPSPLERGVFARRRGIIVLRHRSPGREEEGRGLRELSLCILREDEDDRARDRRSTQRGTAQECRRAHGCLHAVGGQISRMAGAGMRLS